MDNSNQTLAIPNTTLDNSSPTLDNSNPILDKARTQFWTTRTQFWTIRTQFWTTQPNSGQLEHNSGQLERNSGQLERNSGQLERNSGRAVVRLCNGGRPVPQHHAKFGDSWRRWCGLVHVRDTVGCDLPGVLPTGASIASCVATPYCFKAFIWQLR